MENASKALIIAGAILLSILIIGLGMFIYTQAAEAMGDANLNSEQVQAYNAEFENYEGTQRGTSVRTLCDRIRSHNNSNADDTSLQIGIVYGSEGLEKEESSIDEAVTTENVTAVKSAIRAGKTYTVTFTYARSGMIISATIEDKTDSTGT